MKQYVHKPTEISAEQWFAGHGLKPGMVAADVSARPNPNKSVLPRFDMSFHQCAAIIEGQAGYHMVKSGDYICRGAAGELYPVPPEIFEANYTLKPGQPRKPFDEAGTEQRIQDTVQDSIDKA